MDILYYSELRLHVCGCISRPVTSTSSNRPFLQEQTDLFVNYNLCIYFFIQNLKNNSEKIEIKYTPPICGKKGIMKTKIAKMVVVSCMDLRMVTETIAMLNNHGYRGQYDLVSVAGSALSVGLENRHHLSSECRCQLSAWKESICSHVDLAGKLHGAKEVWFIDHEDCGAYTHYYGDDTISEEKQHKHVLGRMPRYFPNIKVRTFWMGLDGTILELVNNGWIKSNIYNPDKYWVNKYTHNIAEIIDCNNTHVTYKYLHIDHEIVIESDDFSKLFCEVDELVKNFPG